MNDIVFCGTEIELNINIDTIGNTSMDDYDFSVEAFTSEVRVVTFSKQQLHRVNSNNYIAILDTTLVGAGSLILRVIAHVPTIYKDSGTRREVKRINPKVDIVK